MAEPLLYSGTGAVFLSSRGSELADVGSSESQSLDEDGVIGGGDPGAEMPGIDGLPGTEQLPGDDWQPGPDQAPGDEIPGAPLPGDDLPGDDLPGANEPGGNQPGGNQPSGNQPGANQPGDNQPGANQPGGDHQDGPSPSEGEGKTGDGGGTGEGAEGTDNNENTEGNENGEGEEKVTFLQKVDKFADEHPIGFGSICVGAGVALTVIVALIVVAVRAAVRRARRGKNGAAVNMRLRVDKLHEQGARKGQQDCFAVSPTEFAGKQGVLAVVADGMGGLSDGDKVSQAAVSAALNGFFTAAGTHEQILLSLLAQSMAAVNGTIGPNGITKSGTTMVMGLLRGGLFSYLCVGDSRIVLLRDGDMFQLNREHIYKNELAQSFVNGKAALREVYESPKKGALTSYLGMGELKHLDIPARPVSVRPGDRIALMTDGVYNALPEAELVTALSGEDPAGALRTRISSKAFANQDNYTAVILSVESDGGGGRRK